MSSEGSKIDVLPPRSDSVASSDSGFMDNVQFVNESVAGSSKADSVCSDELDDKGEDDAVEASSIITKEMIKEEEKLRIQADKEMEKLLRKSEAEAHDKEIEKKKYQRLQSLLERSQFYSNFASNKLSQIKDSIVMKEEKKTKKRKAMDSDVENTPPPKFMKKGNSHVGSQRVMVNQNSNKQEGASSKDIKRGLTPVKSSDMQETRVTSLGVSVPALQPKLLVGAALRDYQLEGLKWLKMLFLGGMNGILADEMGLGKTIQIISLICHLYEENVKGPFLIVGPLSTLPNWIHEFEAFAPDVPVVLYHGDKKSRDSLKHAVRKSHNFLGITGYPVVITSYEIPLKDKNFLGTLSWKYIIVDEGHRLKNHNTLLARTLSGFRSVNRMLLTGTPLQNNLYELWSLLHFLIPEVFNDLDDFQSWFAAEEIQELKTHDTILQKEKENRVISTLHKILEPFLLRRVKSDVSLNLPTKQEKYIYCPLTDIQYKLYSQCVDRSIVKLTQFYKPDEEDLVIPDNPDGTRAKRRTKRKFSVKNMQKLMDDDSNDSSVLSLDESSKHSSDFNDDSVNTSKMDVTLESRLDLEMDDCFKFRLTMNNVMMMLRKVSNHPYLVHRLVHTGTDFLKVDERIITSSGKMMVLDNLLQRLKQRNHKVLIFSTLTMMLDLLECFMELKKYNYVRLDGSSKIEDRKESIKQFNTDPDLFTFLISTRAGGLGINLTAADTVIIFDSDWNPQVDLQAQDRCHRIGQTKPVIVFRLISEGTVDERIVLRAEAKRKLEKVIIQAGEFKYNRLSQKNKLQLDLESLKSRLAEKNHSTEIHSNGSVLTDEQWEKLLER